MKKILLTIGIFLFVFVGGYFVFNLIFKESKSKAIAEKKVEQNLSKNKEKNLTKEEKYINPNVKTNFNRLPVHIKSVFDEKEKKEILKNEQENQNLDNQINEKSEIELLKEKVKEPYYFVLLDWKFAGTNKNVLMISFKVYNLTDKNFNGSIKVKCEARDNANEISESIEDEFYITIGGMSEKIYHDQIMGIISPKNVKQIDCQFIYNKNNEEGIKDNLEIKQDSVKYENTNVKKQKKEIIENPPLDIFN